MAGIARMGSENISGLPEVTTTSVDRMLNWARKHSLWPLAFGTACCTVEMMAALGSRFDLARFGTDTIRSSPRQADLMIVSGRISLKMVPVLQRIYGQMPDPKWVVSMGACASSGGIFDTYAVAQGIDRFIPVDVYIPGCPPRPEDLFDALILLQKKIERTPADRG